MQWNFFCAFARARALLCLHRKCKRFFKGLERLQDGFPGGAHQFAFALVRGYALNSPARKVTLALMREAQRLHGPSAGASVRGGRYTLL